MKYIKKSGRKLYFGYCPYCNKYSSILSVNSKMKPEPYICVFCGETDPLYKMKKSLYKVIIIKSQMKTREFPIRSQIIKILSEYCILQMATTLEIYFRDVYSTLQNLRYVKKNMTLYPKFFLETRNEFTNYGKALRIYRRTLNIDVKSNLTRVENTAMNLLFNKRHAIIHNNGKADKMFIDQTGLKIAIGDPIPINEKEIDKNVEIINKITSRVGRIYNRRVNKELFQAIENQLKKQKIDN